MFAYNTPAVVRIKDRKLGLAKLFFSAAAFIYIVVNNVIIQRGWAKRSVPTGVARLSPLQPQINAQGEKKYVQTLVHTPLPKSSKNSVGFC